MNELVPFNSSVTGSDVAGLFDPSLDSLSADERLVLSALLSNDDRVDVAIPDEIDSRTLWQTLDLCCRVFVRVRRANAQLKLLIGRALVLIKDAPSVYEDRGFKTFDSFVSDDARGLPAITGMGRSELYKYKSVAESMPSLPLKDARDMGATKMGMIATITKEGNSDFQGWVQDAKTLTIPQLQKKIYKSDKQIPEGSMEWDVLQLQVTKEHKQRVEEFLGNPLVQAYCTNSNPGVILDRMISEVETEWSIDAGILDQAA